MKNIIVLFCIAFLVFGFGSCKGPTEPPYPDDSNATPGKRDYAWIADTIKNPYLYFSNIWGDALNNIWTTGTLMSDAIYRFNGQSWILDNRVYISDPDAIWGYGNSVWIGNDKGSIWKFSDNSYTQQLKDFKTEDNFIWFTAMAGQSQNEIYAIGSTIDRIANKSKPIIMKYDGNNWRLDKKLDEIGGFNQIKYCSHNDKYYLKLWLSDYSARIYEYDKKDLKILTEYPPSNGGPTIAEIGGYAFIVCDKKIYRYFNGRMEFIFEVKEANFGGIVWGRNRNDIFIRMQDGIGHYNGTDFKYLIKSSESLMVASNCVILEKDIFIPAEIRRTGYNIIYRGTIR